LGDVGFEVFFLLPAVTIEALAKISLAVEQADADEGNGEIGGALNVISGKNAEATGIDGKGFVDSEFGGEIGYGTRPEDSGMPCAQVRSARRYSCKRR